MSNPFELLNLRSTSEGFRSRPSLYRDIQGGLFPPAFHVGKGGKCARWLARERQAIIAARISGKSDNEIREIVKKLVAARAEIYSEFAL